MLLLGNCRHAEPGSCHVVMGSNRSTHGTLLTCSDDSSLLLKRPHTQPQPPVSLVCTNTLASLPQCCALCHAPQLSCAPFRHCCCCCCQPVRETPTTTCTDGPCSCCQPPQWLWSVSRASIHPAAAAGMASMRGWCASVIDSDPEPTLPSMTATHEFVVPRSIPITSSALRALVALQTDNNTCQGLAGWAAGGLVSFAVCVW